MRRPRFHGHESEGRAVLCSGSRSGPTGVEPVAPGCAVTVRDHPGREPRGENRRAQGVRGASDSGGSRRPTWGRQRVMSPNRRGWGLETAPTPPGSPERLPRRVSSKGNGPHDLTATAGVPPTPSPQGGSGKTWCHRDRAVAPEPEVLRNGGRNQRGRPDRAARGSIRNPGISQ